MSVQSEINRIKSNVAKAYTALEEKGATIPSSKTSQNLASTVATITPFSIDKIYPVGAIYISANATNPSTYLGGTWERFANGKTLVGVDTADTDFNEAEKTGGEKTHKLGTTEMPAHNHAVTTTIASAGAHTHSIRPTKRSYSLSGSGNYCIVDATTHTSLDNKATTSNGAHTHTATSTATNTGGGLAHNNMQPYITVYMWKRTA